MTAVWVGLYSLLTLGAGAAVAGLIRLDLRAEERLAITPVIGIVGGTALTIGLSLPFGLTVATALAGPLLLAMLAAAAGRLVGDPRGPWRESWQLSSAGGRWSLILAAIVSLTAGVALYGHGIFERDGGISAGYSAVWADWANHHSRAASFAVAGNPPTMDPLFSGTPLRYPFLPDFHGAVLELLGLGPGPAYALPGIVLTVCITLLVISLARRLGSTTGAGVIAVVLCFLGGSLGFVGIIGDACAHHGFSAEQCTVSHVARAPLQGLGVIAGTLHDLPGLVAAQPRAYDGLGHENQPLANMQWYTPLTAWWLPQSAFAYGFATALTVLLLVVTALRSARRQTATFALCGLLAGLLPLIHVHSLIALVIVLPVVALGNRRREWIVLGAVCAAVALPRLVQVALGPHGTAAAGNQFPWLEPGWMWEAGSGSPRIDAGLFGAGGAIRQVLSLPFTPGYWAFWIVNLGVALPLCVVLVTASAFRRAPSRLRAVSAHILRPFPPDMLRFCLPFMLIFTVANMVIFQSWDWDNTKLFAYWYLAVALLAGHLIARWWRHPVAGAGHRDAVDRPARRLNLRPRWRPVAAVGLAMSMLLTGILSVLRLLPWTPAAYASGPYVASTTGERRLAAEVARITPRRAVFLTPGRPHDPVLTLAGRTSVMAYYGWLWSYGTDFGNRPEDVRTMYLGCAAEPAEACRVSELLRRYDISYVEVDDRLDDAGVLEAKTDLDWWRSQRFPVVARDDHIVIYDVRQR
ncbi:MAG: hypothetical protein ABR564_05855 [Candidatus Dormibacteria bacterium]